MKCPKCGSENSSEAATLMVIKAGEDNWVHQCMSCGTRWAVWQQERITQLEKELIDAGELHLADEQSIRNLEKKITQLEARVLRAETGNYYLEKRNIELESALREIAEHEHCNISCDPDYFRSDTEYAREQGHRDGHKCAAAIAKRALEGKP